MNKRIIIWLSVLVIVGMCGFGWVFYEKTQLDRQTAEYMAEYGDGIEEMFAQYEKWMELPHDERMDPASLPDFYGNSDKQSEQDQRGRMMASLPELASGEIEVTLVSDYVYGPGWIEEVERYKRKRVIRDDVVTGSSVCVLAAFSIGFGWVVKLGVMSIVGKVRRSRQLKQEAEQEQVCQEDAQEVEAAQAETDSDENAASENGHGWGGLKADVDFQLDEVTAEEVAGIHNASQIDAKDDKSDEQLRLRDVLGLRRESVDMGVNESTPTTKFTQVPVGDKEAATLLTTEPVISEQTSDSLTELTQEVSAIREFAASQQDRVRQLQEGYDWTIIKRFCLRVIRCVDNLEGRIRKLAEMGEDIGYLEDVRDELVFALESSGVEQFEPDMDEDYKGQEKVAEAIRERQACDDASLSGKVAEVVRCGYKYVLNEEEEKVVRAAQVKLYS
jgi:hypothetical protein